MPNLMMPAMLRPQWQTLLTPTINTNSATWDGYCNVSAFSTNLLGLTGARIRLTLTPPTAGANLVLASVWVGMAGTAPSFDGSQVQATFGGSNGVTLTAGGASVVSDPVAFRLTTSGTLLVAFGITSGDLRLNTAATADYTRYYKAADSANAGGTTKSGYTTSSTSVCAVSLAEVLR